MFSFSEAGALDAIAVAFERSSEETHSFHLLLLLENKNLLKFKIPSYSGSRELENFMKRMKEW